MNSTFAKTRTKLMVLLIVVAIVALGAAMVFSAVNRAEAAPKTVPVTSEQGLRLALNDVKSNPGEYPDGAVIQLSNNLTLLATLEVSCSVTLDLNGYVLEYIGGSTAPVITVTEGNFTLTDSRSTTTNVVNGHNITGGVVSGGKAGGVLVSGGNFNFNAGTIAGNASTSVERGGGVTFTSSAHSFTMSGSAAISYNTALLGGGVYVLGMGSNNFVMTHGTIAHNTASVNGGGIYLTGGQGNLLELKGGRIEANTATGGNGGGIYVSRDITAIISGDAEETLVTRNSADNGGGIYLDGGKLTMSGGSVSENISSHSGAGVYAKNSTLSVTDGIISQNTASVGNGAGVYMTNSTFELSQATISGNQITSYGDGAGLYMEGSDSVFTMTSGSITANMIIASGTGAGVYVAAGTVNMQGSPVITENRVAGGKESNLYLPGSQTFVTVTGAMSGSVGVTVDSTRTFTKGYKESGNTTVKGFFSDISDWGTVFDKSGNELTFSARSVIVVTSTSGTNYYADIERAWATFTDETTYSVKLLADVETTSTLTISALNFTLDLNGYMIRNTTNTNHVIEVKPTSDAPSIDFTLKDSRPNAAAHEISYTQKVATGESGPIEATKITRIYGGVIAGGRYGINFVDTDTYSINFEFRSGTVAGAASRGINFTGANANSTATMYSGSSSRYHYYDGIWMGGSQSLTMYGGDSSYNGHQGVCASGAGTAFTMYDGRLNNNLRAGLQLAGAGLVYIHGGDISYNGYTEETGAGVERAGIWMNAENAKIYISGGTITHNAWEGIVTNSNGEVVNITGGEISYNGREGIRLTNSYVRSGVANASTTADADISNAIISYNGWNGVYSKAILNLTNTTVSDNGTEWRKSITDSTYVNNVLTYGTTTLTNCILQGSDNCGLRVNNGTATMIGGEISDSGNCGVILGSVNSKFILEDGDILNNNNGGVYLWAGTFTMNGGRIHDNVDYSYNGGGVCVRANNNSTVELNKGEIYNNTANFGGGVGVARYSSGSFIKVTMSDGISIHDNTALYYGGGVYLHNVRDGSTNAHTLSFDMQGGEIKDNTALYYGGGVYVDAISTKGDGYEGLVSLFMMSGGQITGNEAIYGGGVYYGAYSSMELSNAPYITGNTVINSDTPNNLYITGDNKIKITSTINLATDSNQIGLSFESIYDGKVLTENYNKDGNNNREIKGFVLDGNTTMKLGTSDNEITLMAEVLIALLNSSGALKSNYGDFSTAFTAAEADDIIQLLADIGVQATIEITKNLTLDLNGYMLQSSLGEAIDPLILVTSGTFTIKDSTYIDHKPTGIGHWLVDPTTETWVELFGGVIHGQLKIEGGTVNFNAGSVVNGLSAGTTAHNVNAIGVYITDGVFNLNTDAAICFNRDSGLSHQGGTTVINGGKIYNNVSIYGAGILLGAPNCTMKDGEICGNVSRDRPNSVSAGAGIEITGGGTTGNQTWGKFTMEGGSIHDNIALCRNTSSGAYGAGVNIFANASGGGELIMSGGSIVNNKAIIQNGATTIKGVGICVNGNAAESGYNAITLMGGTIVISGNTVNGVENNILIDKDLDVYRVSVKGFLNEDSRIGVGIASTIDTTENAFKVTTGYATARNTKDLIVFRADDPTQCLTYNGGELQLKHHSNLPSKPMQEATCTQDGVPELWYCDACNRQFTSVDPYVEYNPERDNVKGHHQITEYVYKDNGVHVGKCSLCGKEDVEAAHIPSSFKADGVSLAGKYQHSGICTVCNGKVTLDCTYESNQKHNDTEHWLQCTTCGEHYETDTHIQHVTSWSMRNNSTHRGTCTKCGYTEVIGEHTLSGYSAANSTADAHYQLCELCKYQANAQPHNFVWEEDQDNPGSYNGVCKDCDRAATSVQHQWKMTEWKSDGVTHWHECSMHDNEKYGEEECVITWNKNLQSQGRHAGQCETCTYQVAEANCTWGEWRTDAEGHYRRCTVCKLDDVTDRSGSAHDPAFFSNTETHGERCSVCSYLISESAHEYEWIYNDNYHYQECKDERCDATGDRAPHSLGGWQNADGKHWRECTGCDYATKREDHDDNTTWTDTTHSVECSICGLKKTEEAHDFTSAESWKSDLDQHWQQCTVCGYEKSGSRTKHAYGKGTPNNNGTHSAECEYCGQVNNSIACDYEYSQNPEQHVATCKYCDYVVANSHAFNTIKFNAEQHWYVCDECDYVNESSKIDHDFGEDLDNCIVCGAPSNDLLAAARRTAKGNLNDRVASDKAQLSDLNKEALEQAIDKALSDAIDSINMAGSLEDIDAALAKYEETVKAIILGDKKEVANGALRDKAAEAKGALPEGITDEERARFEQAIDEALTGALNGILGAEDVDQVTSNLEQGKKDIDSAVLATSRTLSKEKLQQHAQAKKDAFQEMVDNGEISQEEADRLKDLIDKEADRAQGKIDKAATVEEVREEQQRGEKVIDDIVANPDLAEDKSQGRDDLEDEAQKKKDEIDEKVKNGELTPEEGEDLKKKVDEETKKAEDNVTDSKTSEEVKDAVDQGKADIGSAAEPKPAKKGFFDFINGNFPVHIAAITLGAMLLVMIILAIAARKRKQK